MMRPADEPVAELGCEFEDARRVRLTAHAGVQLYGDAQAFSAALVYVWHTHLLRVVRGRWFRRRCLRSCVLTGAGHAGQHPRSAARSRGPAARLPGRPGGGGGGNRARRGPAARATRAASTPGP